MAERQTPEAINEMIRRQNAIDEMFGLIMISANKYAEGVDADDVFGSIGKHGATFDLSLFPVDDGHIKADIHASVGEDDPDGDKSTLEDVDRIELSFYSDGPDWHRIKLLVLKKNEFGDIRLPSRYANITADQLIEINEAILE